MMISSNTPNYNSFSKFSSFRASKSIKKEQIEVLIAQGANVKKICDSLSISRRQYYDFLNKFDITTPRKYNFLTPQRQSILNVSLVTREKILEMRKANKTMAEICQELNISRSSYCRILNKSSELK